MTALTRRATRRTLAAAMTTSMILAATPALAEELSAPLPVDPYSIGLPTDLPNLPHNIGVPASEGSSQQGVTGVLLTAPYSHEAGAIRKEFGAPGPHPVAYTNQIRTCSDLFFSLYNFGTHFAQGTNAPVQCSGTFPSGPESPFGYQFVYPADLNAAAGPAPLVVMSPGIGSEPGNITPQASFYASHGYVVAIGYNFTNWLGGQVEAAAAGAIEANANPQHPLHGLIDTTQTILVGHSAGGGSVIRVANTIEQAVSQAGAGDFKVAGVVGVNPGPADFGLASPATDKPLLILAAENESLVPHPLSRLLWDRATGPKWWSVIDGAFHGTFFDPTDRNVYGSLIMAFAEYNRTHSPRSAAVFEGDGLANDSELLRVERANV